MPSMGWRTTNPDRLVAKSRCATRRRSASKVPAGSTVTTTVPERARSAAVKVRVRTRAWPWSVHAIVTSSGTSVAQLGSRNGQSMPRTTSTPRQRMTRTAPPISMNDQLPTVTGTGSVDVSSVP